MRVIKQCGHKSPESGFLCILIENHEDPFHLSIDNKQMWGGSPGQPVRWETGSRTEILEPDPTPPAVEVGTQIPKTVKNRHGTRISTTSPQSLYTGETCDNCSSMRMLRTGKCSTCQDCGSTSSCS